MAIAGRVALITGAAQGLGKAFSESLLKLGAKVCVADIAVADGEKTVEQFKKEYGQDAAFFTKCDVTSKPDMESAFEKTKKKYGSLDIVVNNAGIGDEIRWDKTIDINLKGVIQGTQLGIDYMSTKNGGSGGVIINISSLAGVYPMFFAPVYSASKFAVVAFVRSLAMDRSITKQQIRINCLCPAFADTNIINFGKQMPHANVGLKAVEVMGILQPSEVAEAFLELVQDESKNGAVMKVLRSGREYVDFPTARL